MEASSNMQSNGRQGRGRSKKAVVEMDIDNENNHRAGTDRLSLNIKARLGAMNSAEEKECKRSLMALARVQEVAGIRTGRGGYEAPMASPIASIRPSTAIYNTGVEAASTTMTMRRPSLDEHKKSQPWLLLPSASSRISSTITSKVVMEPSRHSWDGHLSVQPCFDHHSVASTASTTNGSLSSTRQPAATNVVARLMGLDDIPSLPGNSISRASMPSIYNTSPATSGIPPHHATHRRPSSTEVRLIQQLLQYTPPDPSPAAASVKSQAPPDSPTSSSPKSKFLLETRCLRTELRSVLKRLDNLSQLAYDHKRRSASLMRNQCCNKSPLLTPGRLSSPDQSPRSRSSISSFNAGATVAERKYINEGVPVVDDTSPNYVFQDEIEKRLRQLGLQSCEQERKTLKQILDAMHLKGLLRPPASPARSEGSETKFQVRESSTLSLTSPSARSSSSSLSSLQCSKTPTSDASSTSIVIMKPLGRTIEKSSGSSRESEILGTTLKRAQKSFRKSKLVEDAPAVTNDLQTISLSSRKAPLESASSVEAQSPTIKSKVRVIPPVNDGRSSKLRLGIVSSSHIETSVTGKPAEFQDAANSEASVERLSADSHQQALVCNPSSSVSNLHKGVYDTTVSQVLADTQFQETNATVSSPELCLERQNDEDQKLHCLHNLLEGRTARESSDDFIGKEESEQGSPVSVLEAAEGGPSFDKELHSSGRLVDITEDFDRGCSSSICISSEDRGCNEVSRDWLVEQSIEGSALGRTNLGAAKEQSGGVCLGNECSDASNKEFVYIGQVLKGADLTEEGDMRTLATKWIMGGCRVSPNVYEDLEEAWEAAQDHIEEVEAVSAHADDHARDLGGELYRKSRQAAVRRKLIFDCVDGVVRERLREWVDAMPAGMLSSFKYATSKSVLAVQDIWAEVRCLETCAGTSSPHEDFLYGVLSQDLDSGRSPWNHWESQQQLLVQELEDAILDSVLEELVAEVSSCECGDTAHIRKPRECSSFQHIRKPSLRRMIAV